MTTIERPSSEQLELEPATAMPLHDRIMSTRIEAGAEFAGSAKSASRLQHGHAGLPTAACCLRWDARVGPMRAPGAALASLRRVHELLAAGAVPASIVVLSSQWRHARVVEHLLDVALPMGAYEVTCTSEAGFAAACLEAALGAA